VPRQRRGRNPPLPGPRTADRTATQAAPPDASAVLEVAGMDPQPPPLPGVRPTSITCDWCGRPTAVKPRGRVPRWCSETCRHRSWEQDRAAASGRSAICIVERAPQVAASPAPANPRPTPVNWPQTLSALAAQLDSGRVYDRDLVALSTALAGVLAAYERHPGVRARSR